MVGRMLVLAAVLSWFIGLVLGLLGGGGAILTLPMLVYVLQVDARQSIASSLFVVGVTSAFAMLAHARAGRVQWKAGLLLGLAGMAGAYGGGRLAHFVPGRLLLLTFGLVMFVTALAMLRGRRERPTGELAVAQTLGIGSAVGAISGLIGAGGGFLIVPALNLFGGLAMQEAVATSLFVITMQSFAGLGGHLAHTILDWRLILVLSSTAVIGSVVGARLAGKVPSAILRRAFAWMILGMAVFFIAQQLPDGAGMAFAAGTAAAVAIALGVRRWVAIDRARRAQAESPQP